MGSCRMSPNENTNRTLIGSRFVSNPKVIGSSKVTNITKFKRKPYLNDNTNIKKNVTLTGSSESLTQKSGLSLAVQFDELVKNRQILTSSQTEKKFLTFSAYAEENQQKWRKAELECQRLLAELAKSAQEIAVMDCKLKQAREMLQRESEMRKKAENDRDKIAKKLSLLVQQQLVGLDRQLVKDAVIQEQGKFSRPSIKYDDLVSG